MKIIDLLNKIANGEEVPKKIKYKGHIYQYQYKDTKEANIINYYHSEETHHHLIDGGWHDIRLNDEVEIIEEEKKIPEKLKNEKEFYAYTRYEENKDEIDKVLYILKAINLTEKKIDNLNNSINSIIDYLQSKGE